MPKEDVLPDAQGSREFRAETAKLVSEATPQKVKFEALARELECDEDEDAFKAAVRKIGTAPRGPKPKDDDASQ